MKLKKSCCEKYRKKAKLCKSCPLAIALDKRARKKLLRKHKKKLKKADAAGSGARRAA